MNRYDRDRMIGDGTEFNAGRRYVMEHLEDHDESFWYGIINALRSQGIRESNKNKAKAIREANASVNAYLKTRR